MTETEAEATAKQQLLEIAAALEAIRFQLMGVQASLPASPMERERLLEEDEMDPRTEIRTAIGCVLEDRIDPAIRNLQAVALNRLEEKEGE